MRTLNEIIEDLKRQGYIVGSDMCEKPIYTVVDFDNFLTRIAKATIEAVKIQKIEIPEDFMETRSYLKGFNEAQSILRCKQDEYIKEFLGEKETE